MRQDKHDTSSTRPSLSLYEITVPVMIAGFNNMSKFLDRGRGHADEKGIAHGRLLNARLADDMMKLVQQVQRASDAARLAAVRVARVDNIAMPDRETTFEDLQARVSATVSFLAAVSPAAFEANADAELVAKFGDGERILTVPSQNFVRGFCANPCP